MALGTDSYARVTVRPDGNIAGAAGVWKRRVTRMLATFACAMFASVGTAWAGTGSWTVQSTPNHGRPSDLNGVSCRSGAACVAVGGTQPSLGSGPAGRTLTELWNGQSWSQSNSTYGSLAGVSCWAANGCMAVGATDDNEPLSQIWHGGSWKTVKPAKTRSGGGYFEAIACWSSNGCMAVGYDWNHTRASNALAEAWNGRAWRRLATPPVAESDLLSVSCWSGSGCVAVGDAYTPSNVYIAEIWNGRSWKALKMPHPSTWAAQGVSCWSRRRCIAVGSAYGHRKPETLAEVWNGRSWTRQQTSGLGSGLTTVSCSSRSGCMGLGDVYVNGGYQPIALAWNGRSWAATSAPRFADSGLLNGVACWSSTACEAVGEHDLGPNTNQPVAAHWG